MRTNKFSIGGLTGAHASSIVNEVIKVSSLLFFNEKILSVKKAPKCKINDFRRLRSLKIVAFIVLCLLNFVLLVRFCL